MTRGTAAEWAKLQARYAAINEKLHALDIDLRVKYSWAAGTYSPYLSRGESAKLDSLRDREYKAGQAIMEWLDRHSPRNWHSTVPFHWICSKLTFESATTRDAIMQDCDPGYGSTDSDVARLFAPLPERAA